jgi:hypothetical protein
MLGSLSESKHVFNRLGKVHVTDIAACCQYGSLYHELDNETPLQEIYKSVSNRQHGRRVKYAK